VRRLSEVAGTKVMSRTSAQKVGKVERVLVDVPPRRVMAVQIGRDEVVDWESVSGLGTDAVVVEDEDRVRAAADAREERAIAGDYDWKGKRVLTDLGHELGTVTDVEIDEVTGALEVVETTEGRLPASRLHAIGSYCVVVRGVGPSDRGIAPEPMG
jgi:sporulation protein YlmC with PRC-barrel domain